MDCRCAYGFGRTVDLDCSTVLERLRTGLEDRGFSILFQLEVGDLWKEKESQEGRYVILGACNARAASRAFTADRNIGLVLPRLHGGSEHRTRSPVPSGDLRGRGRTHPDHGRRPGLLHGPSEAAGGDRDGD